MGITMFHDIFNYKFFHLFPFFLGLTEREKEEKGERRNE